MDTKQIKTSLKAAREAIRNKEFKDALRHCKAVLTKDRENYMALVLIAVAAEGLEQYDQALKAYKRAIDADDTQLLAWQGLSSYYEKHESPENVTDRFDVYSKLIDIHKQQGDSDKKYDCIMKLASLATNKTDPELTEKIVSLLMDAEKSENVRDRKTALQQTLMTILQFSKIPDRKDKIQALSKDILENVQEYSCSLEGTLSEYLTGISQAVPSLQAENVYSEMYKKFPSSPAALEFSIIHSLDKFCVALDSCATHLTEDFEAAVSTLENLNSQGSLVLVCRAYMALCRKEYVTSRNLLSEAVDQSSSLVCTYVLYSWTSLISHQNEAAASICQQGLNALTKKTRVLTVPAVEVTKMLYQVQTQSLYSIGDKLSLEKALEIIQKEMDMDDPKIKVLKGLIHVKLKDIESAKGCIPGSSPTCALLEGLLLEMEEKCQEALKSYQKAVEMEPHNATFLLHLAKCQFRTEGQKKESFGNLLQAAKQDPFDAEIFLYLGHYYCKETRDMTRARKCYQKAFDLDPTNNEVGEALCDILNKEGDEEEANKILLKVTSKANAGCAKWAWLRLGLYQLKYEDPSVAIASLQAALRADRTDTHVWECLGEAYYSRGSFTAALKAFNRASELNPDSMYCLFQMAFIKQALAMYTEAVEEYQHVLGKSPNYVPALKGLGETYILKAKSYLTKYLHGRARDTCQEALNVLLRAASMRPDLSCLWKLAGDSCTILHVLPGENFSFEKTDKTAMNKLETLQFGGRCYIKAVKILPECSSLWHDLGMNYFHQSKCSDGEAGSQLMEKSVQAIKKAIQMEPANHRHWTALGFIASSEGYFRPSLAQHCFIKSIQAENNNVVAWTNLAALYLKHDNVKLAHEAFKIAQRLEPSYVSCWIGQAIIAEIVGHEDAMDLFRHTTDLGNHLEGALGYGHWVCTIIQSKDIHDSYVYQYAIEQMAAVPASIDVLARYTDRVKTNPVAYNMYGLLLERQKLFRTAAVQFKFALELLRHGEDGGLLKDVTCNYARVLCACGDYEESCTIYEMLDVVDNFTDLCQSALAFYKCGKLEQSFQAYNKAADLDPSDADKSHVLTAVAMVIFKFGNPDSSKTKLFESAQMSQPSVHGLKALCALGLLQSDDTLALAALQELYKLEDNLDRSHKNHVALFTVLVDQLQGNAEEGLRKIQKQLMRTPNESSLWQLLTNILLRYFPKLGVAIASSAKTAILLEDQCTQRGYGVLSLGQLSAGYHSMKDVNNNALTTAQRAVYLYPGDVENWACLVLALHAEAVMVTELARRQTLLEQELNILTWILNKGDLSLGLKLWCHKQRIVCSFHAVKHTEVLSSLETLLEDFGTEQEAKQVFEVFQHVMKGNTDNVCKVARTSDLLYYWEIAVDMYLKKGLEQEAESVIHQYITNSAEDKTVIKVLLVRLAYEWYLKTLGSGLDDDHGKFEELARQVLSVDPENSAVCLMQGILHINKNMRMARYQMQDVCRQEVNGHMTGSRQHFVSLARRALVYILKKTKKDTEIIEKIAADADLDDDTQTISYLKKIGQ